MSFSDHRTTSPDSLSLSFLDNKGVWPSAAAAAGLCANGERVKIEQAFLTHDWLMRRGGGGGCPERGVHIEVCEH